MNIGQFFQLLIKSSKDLIQNPILFLIATIFYILTILISKGSVKVQPYLQTSISLTLWTTFIFIIVLVLSSLIISGFIALLNNMPFFKSAKKFCLRNFAILLIIYIIWSLIILITSEVLKLLSLFFALSISNVITISIIILFAGLAGVIIFLTFSNFYIVIENSTIKESIKKSISKVKKEYLSVLSLSVLYYLITEANNTLFEKYQLYNLPVNLIIFNIILIPYFIIVLNNLIREK